MSRNVKVKLDFYDISIFGYTQRGEEEVLFGESTDILLNLKLWLKEKKIRQTKTFKYKSRSDSNLLGVYCPILLNDPAKKSFFMMLWNEIPNEDGAIASLNGEEKVGEYSLDNTDVPSGNIPGFGTYFWFMPEHKIVVAIRINEELHLGREAMGCYILGFMKNNSPYVRHQEIVENGETVTKVRYALDSGSEAQYLVPRFETRPARNKTQVELLRKCCGSIRKGIRKEVVSLKNPSDRGFINYFLRRIKAYDLPEKASEKQIKYRYEFDFQPSLEELNHIIENHKTVLSSYDDLGFKRTGSNETIWLSSILCKTDDILEVAYSEDGKTLDAQSFYEAVEQQKAKYLAVVKR